MPSSGAVFLVPKNADPQYGQIKVVCIGDQINATAQLLDQSYTVTKIDSPDTEADFVFAKDGVSTEYAYTCSNGVISGGVVLHERP